MSGSSAPAAPGRLGQPVDVISIRNYLVALDEWLDARRAEIDELDAVVRAGDRADELTPDIALGLQLWQSIQSRFRRLLQVWDNGRVGPKEREQLSSLVWGRLDDDAWGGLAGAPSGMSLPEACRMSDALTGQLRSRLQLDPAGTEAVGRMRDLRASMERLRDQVALEPPQSLPAAQAKLADLEDRVEQLVDKAGRGGDVGGLLGPLEADAATFERDLIVGGALRRQRADAGVAAPQPAAAEQPQQPGRVEVAGRLRADLIVRGQRLAELVATVAQAVDDPPKYAVPDVTALGPVPPDAAGLDAYVSRLERVSAAMDLVEQANSQALRGHGAAANELVMVRDTAREQKIADDRLTRLLDLGDELAALDPRPDQAVAALVTAGRSLVAWLASARDASPAPDEGER